MARNIQEKFIKYNTKRGIANGTPLTAFQVAILCSNQAKALAPVDKGGLVNSIMAIATNGQGNGFNKGGKEKANIELNELPPKDSAHFGTAQEYAIYQEFGTRKAKAQPYLRPAAELVAKQKSTEEVIAKYFTDELVKSARSVDKVTTKQR